MKQRGQLSLNERLVYDSRIWKIIQYNHNYWWPLNIPNSAAGWRFVKGNEAGTFVYNYVSSNSNDCGDGNYSNYYSSSMTWTDPSGTAHLFDALYNQSYECDGSSGQSLSGGYATDASGYQVADDGNGNPVVKDGAGTEVYPQVIDRFGNYYSPDGGPGPRYLSFAGRAHVDPSANDEVYAAIVQGERDQDPDRNGVAVTVDVDSVNGFGDNGPFRMEREAS